MSHRHHDVVILGGGPAGMGVALALAGESGSADEGSLKVAVVEQSGYETFRVGETVPPPVRHHLTELGVWSEFLAAGHLPSSGSCSCWGSSEPAYHDHLLHPWGTGWHLDRRRFDRTLAREAERRGVEVLTFTRCRRSRPSGAGGYELLLEQRRRDGSRQSFRTRSRFVVDATGRRGAFARAQGARQQVVDRLLGIYGVFRVRPGRSFETFTLVESRPEGWWYSALLPDERVVVALMVDSGAVPRGAAGRRRWRTLLDRTAKTRQRLTACDPASEPLRIVPAGIYRLSALVGEDWLAVGDTASAFDPLSSQGIVKALGTASRAAAAVRRRLDGDPRALATYGDFVSRQFREHLHIRKTFYDMEKRWPEAPFWSRRNHVHPNHVHP